jgi:hypothetical protein
VDELGDTALASEWKVIGSTATVDAIDNIAAPINTSGVSIWRLDGVKLADDYADFWDGQILAPINTNEAGERITDGDTRVWTGTEENGRKGQFIALPGVTRNFPIGTDTPTSSYNDNAIVGEFDQTSHTPLVGWLANNGVPRIANKIRIENEFFSISIPDPIELRLYGISDVFTVEPAIIPETPDQLIPSAVPEPSSAILLGVGVICVGWSRFRRKRRQASSTV